MSHLALARVVLASTAALLAAATPASAAPLRVLLTNDDGIKAAGIDQLAVALAREPEVTVTIIAPAANQSGVGGRTTAGTLTAAPATTRSGLRATAVNGTPADSVRYAFDTAGVRPDLVVSGLNDGANLGPIIPISGTIGAARAAAARGVPALATSQGSGSPARFADGVASTITWLRANRDALRPRTVASINTPTCRFAGKPAGLTTTRPSGLGALLTIDFLRSLGPIVCPARPGAAPADDLPAFSQGYATLSDVGLG